MFFWWNIPHYAEAKIQKIATNETENEPKTRNYSTS